MSIFRKFSVVVTTILLVTSCSNKMGFTIKDIPDPDPNVPPIPGFTPSYSLSLSSHTITVPDDTLQITVSGIERLSIEGFWYKVTPVTDYQTSHNISWDGKGDNGEYLPSGSYIIKGLDKSNNSLFYPSFPFDPTPRIVQETITIINNIVPPPFYGVGDLLPGKIPTPINYKPIWIGNSENPCTSIDANGNKGSFTIASAFDFHTKNASPSGGPDITLVVVPTSNYPNTNGTLPNIGITTPDITTPRNDLVHRIQPNNNDCLKYKDDKLTNKFPDCQKNLWESYVSQDISTASIPINPNLNDVKSNLYPMKEIKTIVQDIKDKGYKNVGQQIGDNNKVLDATYIYTAALDLNGTTLINNKIDISKKAQVGVDYPIKLKIGNPEQTVTINLKKLSESPSQGIKWSVSCGN